MPSFSIESEPSLKFSANITPEESQKFLAEPEEIDSIFLFGEAHELTTAEQEKVEAILANAHNKITTLGIKNAENLLPSIDQIVFDRTSSNDMGGSTSEFNEYIAIEVAKDVPIDSPLVATIIYHEISHFITKVVVKKLNKQATMYMLKRGGGYYEKKQRGFQLKESDLEQLGLFEEGIAALFSAYCAEDVVEDPYNAKTPFMIAFLQEYAERANISEFEAFRKTFVSKVNQDFSIQKEWVDLFGRDFVLALNNAESMQSITYYDDLIKAAELGGFQPAFEQHKLAFEAGTAIGIEGMPGKVKRTRQTPEHYGIRII